MDLSGDFDLPDPIDVNRAQFETIKRGYDPAEVRSYLADVARGLGAYRELVKELEWRMGSLESELDETRAASEIEISETELTERLGTETAKILNAAREAAEERRLSLEAEVDQKRAEVDEALATARREAEQLVENATAEASRIVTDRLAEADADIAEMITATEADVAARLAEADERAAEMVADGEESRDAARQSGRAMVAEAQVVRERILADLARRRQSGRRELEQIRAGRDRLLAAFNLAGDELGGLLEELRLSLPEARAAAQRAGHSVDLEELTAEQFEHELEAARLVGHPLVDVTDQVGDVDETGEAADDDAIETDAVPAEQPADDEPAAVIESAAVTVLEPDDQNVVLAELGARRSRLTKAGRIAQQLPTGEIPVLKAAPPFETVRVLDDAGTGDPPDDHQQAGTEPAADELALDDGVALESDAAVEIYDQADEVAEPELVIDLDEDTDTELAEDAAAGQVDEEAPVEDTAEDAVVEAAPAPAADEAGDDHDAGDDPAEDAVAEDDTVELLFAKVRAGRSPEGPHGDDAGAVATLARPDERVTVLDDDPVAGRDRLTQPLEEAVTRALKRALADDQNELLDAARRARKLSSVDDLIDRETHQQRYVDAVRAELVEAFHAGATAGGDPSVDTDLAPAETALAVELVGRLREELVALVAGDAADFADGLRSVARDLRRNRIDGAASHAVLTAYNRGVECALADAPRRWVRDERHECGLDCEANARAGAVAVDYEFDGELSHPPMFPGCRCQLTRA